MKIKTEYWAKPIPNRNFDWSAIDDDTYDGAPDSSTRNQIGYGRTEQEAIADLEEQLFTCTMCRDTGWVPSKSREAYFVMCGCVLNTH